MCGIAGILQFSGATPAVDRIESMTRRQRHRGPDGEGIFRRQGVALGHRRLSIIDIDGGQQPMSNETGDIWLTFNGEIYNFRELRRELADRGHEFASQSDSEVIVHAYEEWGDTCVERLRGMFAFAIADFPRQRLLLARDQLGIKPLFYRVGADYVAFASELPALLGTESETPRISCQALDYYLRYRYIPAPATVYESIVRLPAAHIWSCRFSGEATRPREYWRLDFSPVPDDPQRDWLGEFEQVLDESVRAHLVSDVPLGAFLSGGIDSTLIAATMARHLQQPVKAFSIGFDEGAYSELNYARQAADALGVELHTEIVRPDVVGIFGELFSRYGEPFADTSAVPTWCVARLAREHVTTVLSGDGADEAFAGYGRYDAWVRDTLLHDAKRALRQPKHVLRRALATVTGTWPERLQRWQDRFVGVFDQPARQALWRDDYRAVAGVPCSAFGDAGRRARQLPPLEYAQYLDLKTYLPGDILTKVDIATMCHGLEARTPFTDLRVMEFAAQVPTRWRRASSRFSQPTLKALPKQLLMPRFPAAFVHRRKQGFAIPEAEWLQRGTPIRACFDDVVASPRARIRDYFSPPQIEHLIRRFDGQGQHATGLWLLLILGLWLEQPGRGAQRLAA